MPLAVTLTLVGARSSARCSGCSRASGEPENPPIFRRKLNRSPNMHFKTSPNPSNRAIRTHSPPPQPPHFRLTLAAKLTAYKAELLEEFNDESEAFLRFVRLAVNDAESLAWSTPYAHLFLPVLVEEKIQYARQWADRQSRVSNGLGLDAIAATPAHDVVQ
jgi:hypothetical protein